MKVRFDSHYWLYMNPEDGEGFDGICEAVKALESASDQIEKAFIWDDAFENVGILVHGSPVKHVYTLRQKDVLDLEKGIGLMLKDEAAPMR